MHFIPIMKVLGLNGSFRLDMWNQFRVDMRTNNKCERYNSRLAKKALKANLNVYELILLFKEDQIKSLLNCIGYLDFK